jgi:hypothetical protein
MTTIHRRWRGFAARLLLLHGTLVCGSAAQDRAASASAASVTVAAAGPVQASPQQTGADVPPQTGPKQLTNYFEAGDDYLTQTNGFGYSAGGYARGVVTEGKNILNAEGNGQPEFGDAGVYLAAGDTYNFSPDWYGPLTLGSSDGGFFWPSFRGDGIINSRWMARKQFIATFGFGYYAAKDVHRDHSFFVGSTYSFTKPWILEEGIRFKSCCSCQCFTPSSACL